MSDLQVTTPTTTTLNITWTVHVSGSIARYQVTYSYVINRCLETGGPLTVDIPNNTGPMMTYVYTLRDLNEDSNYTITVTAINIAGTTMATISADTLTSSESIQLHSVNDCTQLTL